MFRSLIALLITCALTFTGLTAPAYADSNHVGGLSLGAKQFIDSHDTIIVNAPIVADTPSPSIWENLLKNVGNGVVQTVEVVAGGAIVCYALDGAAATIFPPAAALLPYCPAVGAAIGSKSTVKSGFDMVAKAL